MKYPLTVIVPVEGSPTDDLDARKRAAAAAGAVVKRHANFSTLHWFEVQEADDDSLRAAPLDTPDGEELVATALDRQQTAYQRHLTAIQSHLQEVDTIEVLFDNDDFVRHCYWFGAPQSNDHYLYDGTSWQQGDPIRSREVLADITAHAETPLYAVVGTASY